jgi:hypothetical protein
MVSIADAKLNDTKAAKWKKGSNHDRTNARIYCRFGESYEGIGEENDGALR